MDISLLFVARLAMIFIVTGSISCRPRVKANSDVKVTNGIKTDKLPAVTCLNVGFGCCTGVFINETTMLTAGHCLGENSADEYTLSVNGTAPTEKHYVASAYPKPWESPGQDLAILKFPPTVTRSLGISSFLPISQTAPRPGDPVTLIGFGKTDHSDNRTKGVKHYGSNNISAIEDWKIYLRGVSGPTNTPGINVVADSGDSGGPLLNASDEIIGVASMADMIEGEFWATYVSIQNENAKKFLAEFNGDGPSSQKNTTTSGGN